MWYLLSLAMICAGVFILVTGGIIGALVGLPLIFFSSDVENLGRNN